MSLSRTGVVQTISLSNDLHMTNLGFLYKCLNVQPFCSVGLCFRCGKVNVWVIHDLHNFHHPTVSTNCSMVMTNTQMTLRNAPAMVYEINRTKEKLINYSE